MRKCPVHSAVVITAAGNSTRFGSNNKKEYSVISKNTETTVLSESVFKFLNLSCFDEIIITVPKEHTEKARQIVFSDTRIQQIINTSKFNNFHFIAGGATRRASVFNALKYLSVLDEKPEIVLIHDGARPFVSDKLIQKLLQSAIEHKSAVPVIPIVDTQKRVSENGYIIEHLKREGMKAVQTPQAFEFQSIFQAHQKAVNDGKIYTDDSEIFNEYVGAVFTCEGELQNKKITFKEDIMHDTSIPAVRVGLGYDLHKLVPNKKPLILGGVVIPSELGCEAHSDGDALLHAVCDSLLGAVGFSDIGELFPPSDDKWKNANSADLLKEAWKQCCAANNCKIGNIDCVISIERPKILPYRNEIINSIAGILNIKPSQVFVKAKTGEGIGIIGNSQAVAVRVASIIYLS